MASSGQNAGKGARPKVSSSDKRFGSLDNRVNGNTNSRKELMRNNSLEGRKNSKSSPEIKRNSSPLKSKEGSHTGSFKVKGQSSKVKLPLDGEKGLVTNGNLKAKSKQTGLFQRWKNSGLALKNYLHRKGSRSKIPVENVKSSQQEGYANNAKNCGSASLGAFHPEISLYKEAESYCPQKYEDCADLEVETSLYNQTHGNVSYDSVNLRTPKSEINKEADISTRFGNLNISAVKNKPFVQAEKDLALMTNKNKEIYDEQTSYLTSDQNFFHILSKNDRQEGDVNALQNSRTKENVNYFKNESAVKNVAPFESKADSSDSETENTFQNTHLANKIQINENDLYKGSKVIDKGRLGDIKARSDEILKKSTSLSSDSGNTDTSSICDWADGSSDAQKLSYYGNGGTHGNGYQNGQSQQNANGKLIGCSPKRFRKRTPSRSKSVENDDIGSAKKLLMGIPYIDSDTTDSSIDPVTSNGVVSYKRRRIGSQMSEESTESETLSCDIMEKLEALDLTSLNEPPVENKTTENNLILSNLKYAIPYLSDKLKASLANRLVNEDNSPADLLSSEYQADNDLKSLESAWTRMKNDSDDQNSVSDDQLDMTFTDSVILPLNKDFLLSDPKEFDKVSELSNPEEFVFDSRSSIEIPTNFDGWETVGFDFHGNQTDSSNDEVINHIDSDHESMGSNGPNCLPLFIDQSSDSGEADDEFECECDHCQLIRSQRGSDTRHGLDDLHTESLTGTDHNDTGRENHRNFQLWLPDVDEEEGLYRINIEELSPLDLLMHDRRNELELMFENVILQMLAVHPDLLNDHAPPPAADHIIYNLPSITVSQEQIDQGLSCPICLCPCEFDELVTCLPCQHLFHPLCVQAWLKKSGTCPVCRRAL